MVEVLLAVSDAADDVDELHRLFSSIVADEDLITARKELASGDPAEGELGAEEILRIVLDSADLWDAVVLCITAHLQMRKPRLKLTVKDPGGRTATLQASGGKAVTEESVREALDIVRKRSGEAS